MKFFTSYETHLRWAENLTRDVVANAPAPGPQGDSFRADLAGLLCTAYAAAFECSVKAIFYSFADSKHKILASVTGHNFKKINSKIHYDTICAEYVAPFGEIYKDEFLKLMKEGEDNSLRVDKVSMRDSYANLLKWRHAFAHEGKKLATLEEVIGAYETCKKVILITDAAMSI